MKKVVVALVLFVSSMMTAQKMEIEKGDFGFLSGQTAINIEFDYSRLNMMKENKTEYGLKNQMHELLIPKKV